ncbi:hypothetical protein WME89_10360 [Sorangium sp. So ce321]|uniref:hypothetical protein n=1 Tax=Sorangium sp. So ce321 TaxID=3133300 RepID=UPI003F61BD26
MPHEDERVGVLRLGLQRGARPALGVVDAAAREERIAEGDERLDVLRGQLERQDQELDGAIVAIRVPRDGGEGRGGARGPMERGTGRGNMLPRLARPAVREQARPRTRCVSGAAGESRGAPSAPR